MSNFKGTRPPALGRSTADAAFLGPEQSWLEGSTPAVHAMALLSRPPQAPGSHPIGENHLESVQSLFRLRQKRSHLEPGRASRVARTPTLPGVVGQGCRARLGGQQGRG